MNKEKFITAIFLVLLVLSMLIVCSLGLYDSIINHTHNYKEVKCYDEYHNEIIGVSCKEDIGNEYQKELGCLFLFLFLILICIFILYSSLIINEIMFERKKTNFFGFVKK